jgi:hypothetical protein
MIHCNNFICLNENFVFFLQRNFFLHHFIASFSFQFGMIFLLFLSLPFCARFASFFIFIPHFHFKYPFAYLFYVIYFLFYFFSYYIFLRLFTNHRKKYGWMGVNSVAWFFSELWMVFWRKIDDFVVRWQNWIKIILKS